MTIEEYQKLAAEVGHPSAYAKATGSPRWGGNLVDLPEHMWEGVTLWILFGVSTGSFLTEVIEGSLFGAARCADDANRHKLFEYAYFFYNSAPSESFGSQQIAERWWRQGGLLGPERMPAKED